MPEKKPSSKGKSIVDEILEEEFVDPEMKDSAIRAKTIANTNKFMERLRELGTKPPSQPGPSDEPEQMTDNSKDFSHSTGYSNVKKGETEFSLTEPMAVVIELLDKEYKKGTNGTNGTLSKKDIPDEVMKRTNTSPARVREIFRTNLPAFKELVQIIPIPRGHYRLKP